MGKFEQLWAKRPWWPEGTTDREMAEYYFNAGVSFGKGCGSEESAVKHGQADGCAVKNMCGNFLAGRCGDWCKMYPPAG
jgi:hypothetical protein